MADISQDKDKRDIAIFHSESQSDLAQAVKTSIESACSTFDPAVRVEVFDDLHDYGTSAIDIFDDIIETTGIVMFFRCEEFFSERRNGFAVSAAVEDRVSHEDSRRHYTIFPLDIGKKTKVRGKACINQLCGPIVSEDGLIKERESKKIRKSVVKVRKTAASSTLSGRDGGLRNQSIGNGGVSDQSIGNGGVSEQSNRDSRGLEEAIGEGQSRQKEEIAALFPDAPVSNTPSAASAGRTSRDPKARADNETPGGTVPSGPQSVTDSSRRGLRGPTQQDDDGHTRQTEVTSGGSPSLEQDPHRCLQGGNPAELNPDDGNPAELNPDDRNSSAAPSASAAGNRCAMSGISLPAELETQRGNGETRVTDMGDENNSSDLPHSVSPDKQSFTSRPPSFSQHRTAETERPYPGEPSLSRLFQGHQQSRNSWSHISGSARPQGNLVQREQRASQSALRQCWNQTGARPKDCPAPTLPLADQRTNQLSAEQRTNQLSDEQRTNQQAAEQRMNQPSINKGQGQIATAAERHPAGLHNRPQFDDAASQHLPNLRNHGSNGMNSFAAELQNVIKNLENTRLTPPPSPSHDGDHFHSQGGPELSDSSLYQAQPGIPTCQQFPELPSREHTLLPHSDLLYDGTSGSSGNAAFTPAEEDTAHRPSPPRASLQPAGSAGEVGGGSQCRPDTPASQHQEQGHMQYGGHGNMQYGEQGHMQYGEQGHMQYGEQGHMQYGEQGHMQYGGHGNMQYGEQGHMQYGEQGHMQYGGHGNMQYGEQGHMQYGGHGNMQYGEQGHMQYEEYGQRQQHQLHLQQYQQQHQHQLQQHHPHQQGDAPQYREVREWSRRKCQSCSTDATDSGFSDSKSGAPR